MLQFPFPPDPEIPPPGPLYSVAALGLLVGLLLLILPKPWTHRIFRGVWPFARIDRWIRENLKP